MVDVAKITKINVIAKYYQIFTKNQEHTTQKARKSKLWPIGLID